MKESLYNSNGFTEIEQIANLRRSLYNSKNTDDIKYRGNYDKNLFDSNYSLSETSNRKKPVFVISDKAMIRNERRK